MSCMDVGGGDDRTSLHVYEKVAFHLASDWQSEVIMTKTDFFDISLEECIERDSKRENPIGEKVINETYRKYKDIIEKLK